MERPRGLVEKGNGEEFALDCFEFRERLCLWKRSYENREWPVFLFFQTNRVNTQTLTIHSALYKAWHGSVQSLS
jgi:hypothetical protein